MELTDIEEIFNLNSMQDDDIDNIINDGVDVYCQVDGLMDTSTVENVEVEKDKDANHVVFDCSKHVECPTAIVGDQGTCKLLRSTKNRSQQAYQWVAEVPGDLHTKGSLCEAVYKAQKSGGFMYIVNKVMRRPKLT